MPSYALEGIRVLDLSQVAIGPYTTFFLSSLGAEVIKVESNRRPDLQRGPVAPWSPQQMKQYPGGEPGEHPWNRGAYFNQRNRGKLGITLDLSEPPGKAVFKRLLGLCDVLVENFRATVMDRQGLGWDTVHALNPRLVYLKLSSQGRDGPEHDYGSLGSTLEQTAGLASITGYLDEQPLVTNETYPDPVGAIVAVGALIAALQAVRRGGEGCLIDLSQRELAVGIIGEAVMDYAFNARVQKPRGNRSATAAPQSVYRCAGEDMWVALSIESEEQWRALCEVMGAADWRDDAQLATLEGRRQRHDEIDLRLAEWTRNFDHWSLMHRLQALGIPAGAVLKGEEVLVDPHLDARRWWEDLVPPEVGALHRFAGPPWRLSASPPRPSTPAPLLGEHNDLVYLDLLGLDRAEYQSLQSAGIISTEPLWARA